MKGKVLLLGWLSFGFVCLAKAGSLQRIGHTTLTPRHSNPDDKGMYAASIDPVNGYAYINGNYLFKLDITGDLPVQVGPALNTGQSVESAIDPGAGYLYLPKASIYRYAVGTGTNAVTSAGSLTLAAGTAASIAIDTSNHYAYVICTGTATAKVAKVDLTTFTELNSINLNAGETNYIFCTVVDVPKGYAYFLARGAGVPQVVKVKFTPGMNAPVRIGAVALDTTNVFIDGASLDSAHGFAYYGSAGNDTNVPDKVYKVKLGEGDVAPSLVGSVSLQAGEGRLAASVIDPDGGYVYFADDLTYPGHFYQLSLNGTNLPVEIGALPLQAGPSNSPPNGVTAGNVTTNSDGVLPFGEVFFRSAVFDPVRGFAYLGQDSRPNQVVKIQVARDTPFITQSVMLPGNTFQLSFTNTPGVAGTVLATTNLSLPVSNWSVLGVGVEVSSGQFQFTDSQATNFLHCFYLIRSP